jgi:hypothetical protein
MLTSLDTISLQQLLKIQHHTLWGHILPGNSVDGLSDKLRQEGNVHHVWQEFLVKGRDADGYLRTTDERNQHVLDAVQQRMSLNSTK